MATSQKERVNVEGHELTLTNLGKIIYPETGTTKAEVLEYYAAVAPFLIPAAANRPATRKRWVHGVGTTSRSRADVLPEEPGRLHAVSGSRGSPSNTGTTATFTPWSTTSPRSPGWPK